MDAGPKILKARAPLPPHRVEAAVWEADRRVREMVAEAEARAARIVADAEAARTRIHAEAAEAGRAEGLSRAAAIVSAAERERDRLLSGAAPELVRVAVEIARKILGREMETSPATVADLAAAAIAAARDRRERVLHVNPGDAPAVRAAEAHLASRAPGGPIRIVEDPQVERGGAILDTEAGRVDARIEAQLAELARSLEEACG